MAKPYPVLQHPTPWNNLRELGQTVTIAGREVSAVVSQDAVVGDIELGQAGFEAELPYLLVPLDLIEDLGDLHGAVVVVDGENYVVRTVRSKPNHNYTRLVLDAR